MTATLKAPTPTATAGPAPENKRGFNGWLVARIAVVLIGAIMMILPFVIMITTSLEPNTTTLPFSICRSARRRM